MINFTETKLSFSQCLHLWENTSDDNWTRFIDLDTGAIIGLNEESEEVALSSPKEEYRNLDENTIKKLLFTHQAKSASLEQAMKKKIIL